MAALFQVKVFDEAPSVKLQEIGKFEVDTNYPVVHVAPSAVPVFYIVDEEDRIVMLSSDELNRYFRYSANKGGRPRKSETEDGGQDNNLLG